MSFEPKIFLCKDAISMKVKLVGINSYAACKYLICENQKVPSLEVPAFCLCRRFKSDN